MASIAVVGKNGGRTIEFETREPKVGILHDVVVWQLAKRRRGTANTKTRAQVNRTGHKMYSQKGTGSARHGNRAVPTFVGGGVAFGPKSRSYDYSLPKKVRALGLDMAVSDRVLEGKLLAVDGFDVEAKTKSFVSWAKANGLDGKETVLVVTDDHNVRLAARNVPWAHTLPIEGINVYDIMRHDVLVIDAVALEPAQEDEQ